MSLSDKDLSSTHFVGKAEQLLKILSRVQKSKKRAKIAIFRVAIFSHFGRNLVQFLDKAVPPVRDAPTKPNPATTYNPPPHAANPSPTP